jgi:hypothetical protein
MYCSYGEHCATRDGSTLGQLDADVPKVPNSVNTDELILDSIHQWQCRDI